MGRAFHHDRHITRLGIIRIDPGFQQPMSAVVGGARLPLSLHLLFLLVVSLHLLLLMPACSSLPAIGAVNEAGALGRLAVRTRRRVGVRCLAFSRLSGTHETRRRAALDRDSP